MTEAEKNLHFENAETFSQKLYPISVVIFYPRMTAVHTYRSLNIKGTERKNAIRLWSRGGR